MNALDREIELAERDSDVEGATFLQNHSVDVQDTVQDAASRLQKLRLTCSENLHTPGPSTWKRGRPFARTHKAKSSSRKNVIREESQEISFFTGVQEASNGSNASGSHAAEKENQDPPLDINQCVTPAATTSKRGQSLIIMLIISDWYQRVFLLSIQLQVTDYYADNQWLSLKMATFDEVNRSITARGQ